MKLRVFSSALVYCLFALLLVSCQQSSVSYRQKIDLQGEWQFALDTAQLGIEQHWYSMDLTDSLQLPGTTDSNHKGFLNTDTTTMHLNRIYKYEGPAWYRKKVVVTENFENKHVQLVLERTKSTKVWIDSVLVGGSHLLQSPQQFDVSDYLAPGEHFITVMVNNDLPLTPYGNVHIYSDDTQTNWNGIIGQIYLEASARTHVKNLQVYPDIDQQKIAVKLEIANPMPESKLTVELQVEKTLDGKATRLKSQKMSVESKNEIELEYQFDEPCDLWDDYQQPIYHLTAVISAGDAEEAMTVPFGMRKFAAKGTQFTINGRTVFLRGKHEAAVFPLTGFTPMNVDDWRRVYRIAKTYGINHYRFHTYCPPEAAFTAADEEGIYLQAELPFWGGLDADTIADMLKEEGFAMLNAYANHPSFVMFSPGNEIWSGHDRVEKNILAFKEYDNRPLYTMGSNVNIGYLAPKDYSDFFVGARVPEHGDSILGHARLTHAFADATDGGILNTQTPSTDVDFDFAVSQIPIPLISHEIGQYQIYPDYSEIDKYTGVLQARNLEVFRDRLVKAGMGEMDSQFQKASGAWAALCYKAEMEAAIRTKGMAGFQLLDLQDFPGQGTALVGILDAFMDSKGVITPEAWKQSCNDIVLLAEFPKYCWTNQETFQAQLVVANYSNKTIDGSFDWKLSRADGSVVEQGSFDALQIPEGGLSSVGELDVNLAAVDKASELSLDISLPGTGYSNTYPIWIYPAAGNPELPSDIVVAEKLSASVFEKLHKGAKVLLFPQTEDVKDNSVAGHFPPEFWNYGMFKGISEWVKKPVSPGTLGLLMDPKHPVFNDFPTDFHTNWQWFSIIKASNSLILDSLPENYLPIVQVIDNLERDHKLGMIFEFKVGNGRLLVCMSQLNKLSDNPEATQLYRSIIQFMESEDFNPKFSISDDQLKALFY
ncbi:sugar-binding domain-containing protein [Mangrovibacterium diazotrophicum]|uniref:Glycosyl hydrolase family 2 n=1 Tax=Mangrovibacterium diazotrophicum TaxID=1261403 RepID=A0A419W2J8_9BACT|nr:sugar-binding domain-containing protein [Mangrovibacterium diazotrophicum]RKD89707.1 glycosyl hydrolase family 2 [Mangrovibacterium diazotrophicum]